MENHVLDELLNVIAVHRYVNIYSRHFNGSKSPRAIEKILSHIRDAQPGNYCFDIDVEAFNGCVDEEQEARITLGIMAAELSSKQFKEPLTEAISIADALHKLNNQLDLPAIAIFHCFKDINREKEKDILRAIRKFLGMAESRLLGILIISDRRIDQWELFPESRLDQRHLTFFEPPSWYNDEKEFEMNKTLFLKYQPAQNMYEVNQVIDFNEPLREGDPKYVKTEKGRGEVTFKGLLSDLGVDVEKEILFSPLEKSYNLFCGPTGCGKSTELRQLADYLKRKNIFFVLYLDCVNELDHNNLNYPDIMLAIANKLLTELWENNIKIDDIFTQRLHSWFSEKILNSKKLRDFALEVEAGLETEVSIPLLAKLFTKLTGKIKTGATYKEEIRNEIKNSFSDFAASLNQLIQASESQLKHKGKARKLLLIIDGTDKLGDDDSQQLFIKDVDQLMQIQANFIYCAPLQLLYEGNQVQQRFDLFTLPMIKIFHMNSNDPYAPGVAVLKEIIYKRIDPNLFEDETVVDRLIQYSGGNPRLLLRLLKYARRMSDMKQFRKTDVEKAVYLLAMDYKKLIKPEDYEILYKVDNGEIVDGSADQIRRLLFDLAILEYDSGWWRSHPVVRLLEGYKKAAHATGK